MDRKFLGRDGTCVRVEYFKSKGNYIIDSKRKKFIDFLSGWNVGNVGWGVKEIRKEIRDFEGPEYVDPYSL